LLSTGWRGAVARMSPGRTISLANVVDLTHTLSGRFPVIPIPGLTFPFKQTVIATLEQNGVFANRWEMIDHNGTHIDAPSHFIPDRPTLDALPLASLIAPAAVIDVGERARRDPDTALTIDDVVAWERRYGPLPDGAVVFMDSGWAPRLAIPDA